MGITPLNLPPESLVIGQFVTFTMGKKVFVGQVDRTNKKHCWINIDGKKVKFKWQP